jgi:hypothetical protein
MKRILYAIALTVAASGAFAQQVTNATVNGVFVQGQFGTGNDQRAVVASIDSGNANVVTRVIANNVVQLQGGSGNRQLLQMGAVVPSAPLGVPLRTNVTVTGTVAQLQAGSANTQLARIGVIH